MSTASSAIAILIPCFGRKVREGSNSIESSDTRVRRNFWTTIAKIIVASIIEKALPIHTRAPAPKGK